MQQETFEAREARRLSDEQWETHRAAQALAKGAGACNYCARLAGFAATDSPASDPAWCPKCQRNGVEGRYGKQSKQAYGN